MQEAKILFCICRERIPVVACRLEQMESSVDVRADKSLGLVDGAIDVTLGGKIDKRPRLILLK